MSISILAIFGIGSALFTCLGFILYVRSILSQKTKPDRSSWWIWSILMVVAFIAQVSAGATWSLFLTGAYVVGNVVSAVLSLKYGYGQFKYRDLFALIIAGFGIWLWRITNSPLAALLIIIGVDFLGNWLTMIKSWRAPYSEDLYTWILMSLGAMLGVLSVGELNLTRLLFPVYAVVPSVAIVVILTQRRRLVQEPATNGHGLSSKRKR